MKLPPHLRDQWPLYRLTTDLGVDPASAAALPWSEVLNLNHFHEIVSR